MLTCKQLFKFTVTSKDWGLGWGENGAGVGGGIGGPYRKKEEKKGDRGKRFLLVVDSKQIQKHFLVSE